MFGKPARPTKNRTANLIPPPAEAAPTAARPDGPTIAAIAAALAVFLAGETLPDAPYPGFIVRRVRRVSGAHRTGASGR